MNARSMAAVAAVSVGMVWLGPAQHAEADWGGWCRHGFRHTQRVVSVPRGTVRIVVGGAPYLYCRGVFYRQEANRYLAVPAPVGAVVATFPSEHQTVVINGITYYYYDGTFYKGGPVGYTVVPAPAGASPSTEGETLTINVPNANGSYMPVTLRMAKDGTYIGPQGEVYPTRPELSQLRAMYGK